MVLIANAEYCSVPYADIMPSQQWYHDHIQSFEFLDLAVLAVLAVFFIL